MRVGLFSARAHAVCVCVCRFIYGLISYPVLVDAESKSKPHSIMIPRTHSEHTAYDWQHMQHYAARAHTHTHMCV